MQLPHSTNPGALPAIPEGGLTAKLQVPKEALPGDHGARFGEELEQASARSVGDGAEGRRDARRGEGRRQGERAERTRATDAREARRRDAAQTEDRRREAAEDPVQAPNAELNPKRTDTVRRRVATNRMEQTADAAKLPATTEDATQPGDPAKASAASAAPVGVPILGSLPTSIPAASAAPEAAASVAATRRTTPVTAPAAPTADGSKPAAPDAGPKVRTSPEADPMGELLTRREEALDREASILRQLRAQLGPGRRELTMRLDPAELGRMQLRIALRAGRLTASLRAESPEALAAIERQLPELAASLEAQGFEVQEFDLDLAEGGLADERPGTDRQTPAPAIGGLLADALGDQTPEQDRRSAPRSTGLPKASDSTDLDLLV